MTHSLRLFWLYIDLGRAEGPYTFDALVRAARQSLQPADPGRAECPVCGRSVLVRKSDGMLRAHDVSPGGRFCRGSDLPPRKVANPPGGPAGEPKPSATRRQAERGAPTAGLAPVADGER